MHGRFKLIISICLLALPVYGCAEFRSLLDKDDSPASLSADPAQAQNSPEREARLEHAVRDRHIVVGMEMGDVRNVWGDPSEIDRAGDFPGENQRWVYYTGLSSPWSLQSSRVIYFEGGRVVGWETASSNPSH